MLFTGEELADVKQSRLRTVPCGSTAGESIVKRLAKSIGGLDLPAVEQHAAGTGPSVSH